MKLLGHSSLSVTQKYLHPEVDKAAEIVNKRNRKAVVLPDISPDITAPRELGKLKSKYLILNGAPQKDSNLRPIDS